MLKLNMRRIVSLLLALCMVTLPFCADIAFAVEDGGNLSQNNNSVSLMNADPGVSVLSEGDYDIRAILYNKGEAAGATGVELTSDGTDGNETLLEQTLPLGSNFFTIAWTFKQKTSHTLAIKVPVGLYITGWRSTDQILEEPVFTPLDLDGNTAGLQQGTGSYANAETGTLTYTTLATPDVGEDMKTTVNISLFVRIDECLWDKNYGLTTPAPVDGAEENAIEIVMDSDPAAKRILPDVWAKDFVNTTFGGAPAVNGVDTMTCSESAQSPMFFRVQTDSSATYQWAYKKAEVTYQISYSGHGVSGELPVDDVVLSQNIKYSGSPEISKAEGKLTLTLNDYYYPKSELARFGQPRFTVLPSLDLPHNTTITIQATITLTSYSGSITVKAPKYNVTYKRNDTAEIILLNQDKAEKDRTIEVAPDTWYGENTSAIDYLGTLTFQNRGYGSTGEIQVETIFDEAYVQKYIVDGSSDPIVAPTLQVSTFRIPMTGVNVTASVTYAEKVNDAWQILNQEVTVKPYNKNTQTDGGLLCLGEGKYLLKVVYIIPDVLGGKLLYRSASTARAESGGVFHGRLAGARATSKMTLYYDKVGNDYSKNVSVTYVTVEVASENMEYIGYTLSGTSSSNTMSFSAEAGSESALQLQLKAYDYPYTGSTYVPDPVIFFVAPKGMTVKGATYGRTAAAIRGTSVPVGNIEKIKTVAEGDLYRIELGTGANIGGYSMPKTASSTNISFSNTTLYVQLDLKLDATMKMASYTLRDRLYLTTQIPETDPALYADYGAGVGSFAAVKRYYILYHHGVNESDSTQRTFSSFEESVDPEFRVIPLTNTMTYTVSVSEHGAENWRIGTSASGALYLSPTEQYNYRVVTQNKTANMIPQPNTALYIPILQAGMKLPDQMGGANINTMEARLTGPVAVSGDTASAWDIRYSINATATNFNNGSASFENEEGTFATWYTAAEIENDANLYWEDVVCIKAIISQTYKNDAGENAYPVGATDTLIATMEMKPGVVGESVIYSSSAWSMYDSADNEVPGGVFDYTGFTKVILEPGTIDYTRDAEICDQMALKTYDGGQNVSFPNMKNFAAVDFFISNINVVGFELKQSSEIVESPSIPVTEKDRTFGITLQLNENAPAVELTSFTGEDVPLGASNNYDLNDIHLSLSHFDTIIDATSERYVDVTLKDEYGSIELIYRIDILRKLNLGTAKTSIVEGAYYNGGADGGVSTTITVDGVVTAQFVFEAGYIPNEYEVPKFVLGEAFPAPEDNEETKFTLIDMSKKQSEANYIPKYYYYEAKGGETEIPLTAFVDMEDGTTKFAMPDSGEAYALNYVLIVDFDDRYNKKADGYSVRMDIKPIAGALVPGTALTVTTKNERYYFTGTASTDGGSEVRNDVRYHKTTLRDDQFSFDLTLSPGNLHHANSQLWSSRREQLKLTFASGKKFPVGSYLTDEENRVYTPGPDREYVLIPVDNVTEERSMSLTFHSPYEKITAGGILNVGYMSSSPYLQSFATIGGWTNATLRIEFSISQTPSYALRVDGDSHLITKTDKTVDFTVSRNDGATDLSWLAYRKEASGGYASEAVYSGEGAVIDASGWTEGTYRVMFTTTSGAKSYYSLIVL